MTKKDGLNCQESDGQPAGHFAAPEPAAQKASQEQQEPKQQGAQAGGRQPVVKAGLQIETCSQKQFPSKKGTSGYFRGERHGPRNQKILGMQTVPGLEAGFQ